MHENDESTFSISRIALRKFMKSAIKESELEESGRRYTNDRIFAPPPNQTSCDFTESSNFLGE